MNSMSIAELRRSKFNSAIFNLGKNQKMKEEKMIVIFSINACKHRKDHLQAIVDNQVIKKIQM